MFLQQVIRFHQRSRPVKSVGIRVGWRAARLSILVLSTPPFRKLVCAHKLSYDQRQKAESLVPFKCTWNF